MPGESRDSGTPHADIWASPDPPAPEAHRTPVTAPDPARRAEPPPALVETGIPLRPLELGEMLDGAIANIRHNPRVVLGLSLIVTSVVQVAITAGELFFLGGGTRLSLSTAAGSRTLVTELIVAAANLLLTGFAILAMAGILAPVVGRTLIGRSTSLASAWRDVRPRAVRMPVVAGLPLVISLGVLAIALAPVIALVATEAALPLSVLAGLVGLCVGATGAVWLYVLFALAAPAVVLERSGVGDALRRSAELIRRRWWRTFGALVLAALLTLLIGTGMQLPFSLAATVAGDTGGDVGVAIALVLETVGRVVSGTLTNPFNAGVAALLYTDHRIRREGLDLELQARMTGTGAAELSPDELAGLWQPSELTAAGRRT